MTESLPSRAHALFAPPLRRLFTAGVLLLGAPTLFAMQPGDHSRDAGQMEHEGRDMKTTMHGSIPGEVANLIAVLTPASGSEVHGTVTFTAVEDDMVRVEAHVTGLEPDSKHAIHIHEFGDVRAEDGTSAGGHYNPEDHPHGLPDEDTRHAGDFGNLHADEDGVARFTLGVDNVTLFGKENPIIGRSVIVHAKKDDGGQPTGNAGARLAAGVIGVQNVSWQD